MRGVFRQQRCVSSWILKRSGTRGKLGSSMNEKYNKAALQYHRKSVRAVQRTKHSQSRSLQDENSASFLCSPNRNAGCLGR